jgi:hypothetical protein
MNETSMDQNGMIEAEGKAVEAAQPGRRLVHDPPARLVTQFLSASKGGLSGVGLGRGDRLAHSFHLLMPQRIAIVATAQHLLVGPLARIRAPVDMAGRRGGQGLFQKGAFRQGGRVRLCC